MYIHDIYLYIIYNIYAWYIIYTLYISLHIIHIYMVLCSTIATYMYLYSYIAPYIYRYIYNLEMEKVKCTQIWKGLKEFEIADTGMGKSGIGKCCFL